MVGGIKEPICITWNTFISEILGQVVDHFQEQEHFEGQIISDHHLDVTDGIGSV